jgi:hypothetical protein
VVGTTSSSKLTALSTLLAMMPSSTSGAFLLVRRMRRADELWGYGQELLSADGDLCRANSQGREAG